MVTLPTPNKTPGDGAPADDINLVIEAINTLQSEVDNIPAGPQGPQGEPGTPGAQGANASVTVGSTNTGAAGSDAAVTNSGTAQNAIFNFTIPRGLKGDTGATGAQGAQGPKGDQGDRGPTGYGVVAGGSGGYVLAKASNADYDTEWIPAGAAPPVSSVDGRTGVVTLTDLYDAAGAAASAQSAAQGYADSLASNYDAAGAASAAQTAAQSYADGLAVNYDAAGAASAAQTAAQSYADGLAVNYDAAGAAATAQSNAQSYADGLASNYDPAGSASAVAGDLSDHESATTAVHGISDTSNLVYTSDSRLSDERTPLNGSVTTAKIVDANVTNAKLENDSITINGSAVALGGTVTISGLPTQTGHSGEYLTTDGTDASWAPIVTDPTPTVFLLGGM
jgi:hypothetical protein